MLIMKLDGNAAFYIASLVNRPNYNSTQQHELPNDIEEKMSKQKKAMGESLHKFPPDVKGNEKGVNLFITKNDGDVTSWPFSNFDVAKPIDKMDKKINELGIPALAVCYKERFFDIKDICIDEGMNFHGKVSQQTNENHITCADFLNGKHKESHLADDKMEDFSTKDCLNYSKHHFIHYPVMGHVCDSLVSTGIKEYDLVDGGSKVKSFVLVQESAPELLPHDSSDKVYNGTIQPSPTESSQELILEVPTLVSPGEEINGSCTYAAFETSSSASNPEECINNSVVKELPDTKIDKSYTVLPPLKGEIDDITPEDETSLVNEAEHIHITSAIDVLGPTSTNGEESPNKSEATEMQTMETLDGVSHNHTEYYSGELCNGEMSFSMEGSISGRITYSGPISLSVRSDYSTTSNRSFAFPILQNEWNSSPVRMAKADRQASQRKKGWRHGLFCCKF